MKKGDKVKIIDKESLWADKIGTVSSEGEEIITTKGKDLTPVEVVLTLDTEEGEQSIRYDFERGQLELVESESVEALNEAIEKEDLPSFESGKDFKAYFIGIKVRFNGINFDDVFSMREIEKGVFDYSPEDQAEINIYLAHEGEVAVIQDCAISDWDEFRSSEDCFNSSYWDLEFRDGTVFYAIRGTQLDII